MTMKIKVINEDDKDMAQILVHEDNCDTVLEYLKPKEFKDIYIYSRRWLEIRENDK